MIVQKIASILYFLGIICCTPNFLSACKVFQIVLRGGGKPHPVGKNQKSCWGGFFYQVVGILGGMNLNIQTFFKANKTYIHKNIFNCLFLVHNKISLSHHEQLCLMSPQHLKSNRL